MRGTLGRGYSALCRALNNEADESLRLARRVKINEIKSTIILFTYSAYGIIASSISIGCYLILFPRLINFHARFWLYIKEHIICLINHTGRISRPP